MDCSVALERINPIICIQGTQYSTLLFKTIDNCIKLVKEEQKKISYSKHVYSEIRFNFPRIFAGRNSGVLEIGHISMSAWLMHSLTDVYLLITLVGINNYIMLELYISIIDEKPW
jgi:hypothetical protein